MTGILAVYRPEGSVSSTTVNRLLDTLEYRGHDGRNVDVQGPVGFGHQHFYTTPESVGLVQPVAVEGVRLAFDGRLDDRESLIEALPDDRLPGPDTPDAKLAALAYLEWDEAFLDRLVGPFALVLWDEARERLLCARGPAGLRDLYYSTADEGVVVASDARTVKQAPGVPDEINERILGEFLLDDLATPRETFYRGIRIVEPGTFVTFDGNGPSITRYWDPGAIPRLDERDPDVLADRLAELLQEAVAARLRTRADPWILLSGGLDSTIVAAMATSRVSRPVDLRALSMQFENPETAMEPERHRAERRRIEAFLDEYDLPVEYSPLDDEWTLSDVEAHQTPVLEHPSLMPIGGIKVDVYRRMSEAGANVFLTGEGGNCFDGTRMEYYDLLCEGRVTDAFRDMRADPASMRMILTWNVLAPAAPTLTKRLLTLGSQNDPTVVPWLTDEFIDRFDLDSRTDSDSEPEFDCEALQTTYEQFYRSEWLLRLGHDRRKALAAGLQPRHPYLDRRLLEFLFSLPPGVRLRRGEDKFFFRRLAEDLLPPAVRDQSPKFWFTSVVHRGLLGEERETVERLIENSALIERGIVDEAELARVHSEYLEGDSYQRTPIWKVVSTELWLNSLES